MDEGIETTQDIPVFIQNALKQLISLKSNITSIDDFHNDMKQRNVGVNTDFTDFANKVKEFLDTFQLKLSDINNTFIDSYDTFINETSSKSIKTCKRKTNSENTNSVSGGVTQERNESDSLADDTRENSDSDTPILERISKKNRSSLRQKKNENSDSDINLKKRKRRRKRESSRNTSECDNSDSEHSKNIDNHYSKSSSAQNILSEETLESHEHINLKSNKDDDTCKTNNDSDKENTKNTNTKPKESGKTVKSESAVESINSDFDSEKESSEKTCTEKSKKGKTKKVTDSDVDSDLNIRKSKVDSTKYKNKIKSKKCLNDSESDTDKTIISNTEKESKKRSKIEYNSELDSTKSKSDDLKNNKKSKIVNDSGLNKTKTDVSDNDLNSTKSKSKSDDLKNKTESETVNDSDSDSVKSKSKSKNKRKSKIINDLDSDETIKTNDNASDNLDSAKRKTKNDDLNKKKSDTVNDIDSDLNENGTMSDDSDSTKSKSKSDNLKNIKKDRKTDPDSEKSKSKSGELKNKSEIASESDRDKTKKSTVSDSDLNKSKTGDSNKKKENKSAGVNTDKDNSDVPDKANTKDKLNNTASSFETDSDSYLEDPRSTIEKSIKTLEEKRKSTFDSLKESSNSEINNDPPAKEVLENDIAQKQIESKNTPDRDESLKGNVNLEKDENSVENRVSSEVNSENSLIFNLSGSSDTNSTKLNKDKTKCDGIVSDNSESTINTPNENSEQVKDTVTSDTEKKDIPKVGLIKCIDISKLLDPKVKKIEKSSKLDSSVIILSSSESENESKSTRKRQKTSDKTNKKKSHESNKTKKNDEKLNKTENSTNHVKSNKNEEKAEVQTIDSDSSSNDRRRRLRFNKKKETISNKSFEVLRSIRQRRCAKKIVENSSGSDSDSDTTVTPQNIFNTGATKIPSKEKISEIDPNYDYKKDIKFKSECYISLPKIPVEKLKVHYLQGREDAEINRLSNMKSLKRTRQQKGTPSSSDNDGKTVKKRGKLQQRKKVSDDEEQSGHSEHSNNSMSDVPISQDNKKDDKDAKLPIPEDFLDSDGDSNKHSDSSDDEDKDKKKSKNDDKKKSSQKTDKEKAKEDTEENGKDGEKQKEDKEKKKWRNNTLLRGKLSASDSEDEHIRFRNKKNKIEEDIRSEPEEETIVSKKSKTKKQLKRIARRLGSDVSSSEDEKDEYKKSDSENESDKSDKTLSSDSEDDKAKKKPMRRRIKRMKDSEESSDGGDADKKDKKKKKEEDDLNTRKKIRHVWSKDSLADSTKEAAKEEQERKKRIADRQKLYNEIYDNKLDSNAEVDKVVLDFNEETKEELLSVHPDLVKKLKPHQAKGVQFMWTACFESLERAQNTEGSGCILAHCMGLGKTLQVITLIHTLLSNSENTNVKTILVVCPLSTVLNWVSEFKKWLDDLDGEQVNVFDLVQHKQNYERLYQMQDWMKFGGVMVMGYDMFRNLSNPKGKRMSKKLINGFNKVLLEPGPDLVVCDEGHLLKNEKTGISIAMNRLKTLRRIVLTGTPLQNNLKEYFCMVQFVKPNLLGTYKEYLNRFVNPITNGQYTDSTLHDIQIMRKRAHVLHKMLDAVVERRDYNVLAPFLPPKHEYVLFVSLSAVQIELYREYLTKFSRNTNVKGTSYLFQDFQELQRICIHPRVLLDKSNQDRLRKDMEDDDSEGSLKDFINDDESDKSVSSSNESSSGSDSDSNKKASVPARRTRANPGNIDEEPEPELTSSRDEWWSKFCQNDELDNICHSSKIKLLFDILHQCELIGDKVLVFSQSLYSLNLIEYFLAKVDEATQSGDTESLEKVGGHTSSWALGLDYFRMDGSTSCDNRATWCKTFNNEANTRARLFLISTRAGGLGINLVAANRVIIFDVSWNPSFDIQSIYRVYRFGQTKPCYIYRFVTMGTMENKIYERQVTKQAISKRVIDEQQIDRHYNQTDLAELYAFIPIPDEERPTPLVPKDRLFADLLQTHDKQIFKYHEHNSLLEDKADEGLNEEERQAAWEEFENEKKAPKFNLMQTMVRNGMFETLRILVQEDNNGWTPAQINNILPAIVQRLSEQVARGDYVMYRRVEERHEMRVLEQRRMQMIYQQYMQQLRSASGGAPMTPADMNKLAQMFSAYNQTLAAQQQMQPRPQAAGSSAAVSFTQGDPPPLMTPAPPIPHPAVSEIVELND